MWLYSIGNVLIGENFPRPLSARAELNETWPIKILYQFRRSGVDGLLKIYSISDLIIYQLTTSCPLDWKTIYSTHLFKYSDVVSIIIISEINHSFGFVRFHIPTQPIKCYIPLLHSSGLSPAWFIT